MRSRQPVLSGFFLTVIFLGVVLPSSADTIYFKNGRELKGIVVEEYEDRVIISTVDGEKAIGKSELRMIAYDEPDQNYIAMAKKYELHGDYDRAVYYLKKALSFNPESRQIKNNISLLKREMFKVDGKKKRKDVKRMQIIEQWRNPAGTEQVPDDADRGDRVRDELGLVIEQDNEGFFIVRQVINPSPASEAGIKRNDIIISIWGKLTGYLDNEEFRALILDPVYNELRLVIERTAEVNKRNPRPFGGAEYLIGSGLEMRLNGLTVDSVEENGPSDAAGLKPNDLITSIDSQSTRYMPIKEAFKSIERSTGAVRITFRRETVIWH